MKKILVTVALFYGVVTLMAQQTYTPGDAGSKVHFVIKNFGIKTGGDFTGLKGIVKFDANNLSASSFNVTVDANTVNTDNSSRDGHLRKSEYFDVAKYPVISFVSTKIVSSTVAGRFYMYGNLIIKGVTKPVEFGFGAIAKDGGYLFDGTFEINRRDFGVGGNSVSLADKLKVTLSIFAKK
jgi:polyisoprenoid-binding protein YceI